MQDALERVDAFTKTHRGKRIYGWRKETIERSFAEAKEKHGLRYARMLGIRNMREQCFLTAAVQNIKRLVASFRMLTKSTDWQSVEKACKPRKLHLHPREPFRFFLSAKRYILWSLCILNAIYRFSLICILFQYLFFMDGLYCFHLKS